MASETSGCAVLILAVVAVGYIVLAVNGNEREGVVDYSKCAEQITVKNDDFMERLFHEFTCQIVKTQSGKVLEAEHADVSNGPAVPARRPSSMTRNRRSAAGRDRMEPLMMNASVIMVKSGTQTGPPALAETPSRRKWLAHHL